MESVRKCPVCEEPYNVYDGYGGDQSACPQCKQKANNKSNQSIRQQRAD